MLIFPPSGINAQPDKWPQTTYTCIPAAINPAPKFQNVKIYAYDPVSLIFKEKRGWGRGEREEGEKRREKDIQTYACIPAAINPALNYRRFMPTIPYV